MSNGPLSEPSDGDRLLVVENLGLVEPGVVISRRVDPSKSLFREF